MRRQDQNVFEVSDEAWTADASPTAERSEARTDRYRDTEPEQRHWDERALAEDEPFGSRRSSALDGAASRPRGGRALLVACALVVGALLLTASLLPGHRVARSPGQVAKQHPVRAPLPPRVPIAPANRKRPRPDRPRRRVVASTHSHVAPPRQAAAAPPASEVVNRAPQPSPSTIQAPERTEAGEEFGFER